MYADLNTGVLRYSVLIASGTDTAQPLAQALRFLQQYVSTHHSTLNGNARTLVRDCIDRGDVRFCFRTVGVAHVWKDI